MEGSRWRWWGPLVFYMLLIFAMSARPLPESLASAPDKVMHSLEYGLLALLAVRAFARGLLRPAGARVLAAAVTLAALYGASDELHQSFVPGRDPSLGDLGADVLGALVAAAATAVVWNCLASRPAGPRRRAILEERELSHD